MTVFIIEIKSSYYEDKLYKIHDEGFIDEGMAKLWVDGYEKTQIENRKIQLSKFNNLKSQEEIDDYLDKVSLKKQAENYISCEIKPIQVR